MDDFALFVSRTAHPPMLGDPGVGSRSSATAFLRRAVPGLIVALIGLYGCGGDHKAEASTVRLGAIDGTHLHNVPVSTLSIGPGRRPGVRATVTATVPEAGWTLRSCLTVSAAADTAHTKCATTRSTAQYRRLRATVRTTSTRRSGRPVALRTAELRRASRLVAQYPVPSKCAGDAPVDYPADPALRPRPYADEPAYAELGLPSGTPAGAVLLLHGGGFVNTGPMAAASERPQALRWLRRGWVVLNATYRPCGKAVADAEWFYGRLQHDYPNVPLCVSGSSVGGSLAIHLATTRPTSCAISRSGILDPEALPFQLISHPHPGEATTGESLFENLRAALGPAGLDGLIDQRAFARASARILLVREANDWVVPGAQQTSGLSLRRADGAGGRTALVTLGGGEGDPAFVHGEVSPAEYARYVLAEDAIASGLTGPPLRTCFRRCAGSAGR